MNTETSFILNGEPITVAHRPDTTVLDLLRAHLSRTGTKEGCAEGDCGACTILFKRHGANAAHPEPANACIMTLAQIEGAEITTVEGIANGALSTLQERMAENGSSQCGYCTPGIVVALTGLLTRKPDPTEEEIHDALAGNLCRCTGYKPIVEAVQRAAGSIETASTQLPALPAFNTATTMEGSTVTRPESLDALLRAKARHQDAVLLAGGTDLAVPLAGYETEWANIIVTGHVPELRKLDTTESAYNIGAAVTWEELLHQVADDYPSLATLIRRFGSTQIRSMGTVGGNIGTASPIGDGPPSMIALGATITLQSAARGARTLPLEDYFLDYRKTELAEDEVIVSVTLPRPTPGQMFRTYKISKRYDQDISTVCGAFNLTLDGEIITKACIAYGGMAATPKRATQAEAAIIERPLNNQTAQLFAEALAQDFQPLDDWRGTAIYRMRVAQGLFARLVAEHRGERVEVMAL